MARRRKPPGLNPAVLKLEIKMETFMAHLRGAFQREPTGSWRAFWSERGSRDSLGSWRANEARALVKLMLCDPHPEKELSLCLTAHLNETTYKKVDKPDGLVVDYARSFLEDNRELLAEVVLSGGDE